MQPARGPHAVHTPHHVLGGEYGFFVHLLLHVHHRPGARLLRVTHPRQTRAGPVVVQAVLVGWGGVAHHRHVRLRPQCHPILRVIRHLQDRRLRQVRPRGLPGRIPLRVCQLRVQVNRRHPGADHDEAPEGAQPGLDLLLHPVDLVLHLTHVVEGHAIIHDDDVGTGTINLPADTQRLNRGVLLGYTVLEVFLVDVDHVLTPDGVPAIEAALGGEVTDQVRIPARGEPQLDAVQELLRHALSLRDDQDANARIFTDPVGAVVERDSRGLGVLRGDIHDHPVLVTSVVPLARMQVPRLPPLQNVVPLKLVIKQLLLQILLRKLREIRNTSI